jgi:hypothetical protein
MTNNVSEIQIVGNELIKAPEPMDASIAEGVAIRGLFCGIQQRMVTDRITEVFEKIQNDEKPLKEAGHTIALTIGKISLDLEDEIDAHIQRVASSQNHGTTSRRMEQSEIGDLIWAGYDPNSIRFLSLFKRTNALLMTDMQTPTATMWHIKALPARA